MTTPQDPAEPVPGTDPTADPTPDAGAPTAESPWAKPGDQTPQQPYSPPQSPQAPQPWQQTDQPPQVQPPQQYPVPPYQGEQYPTQQFPTASSHQGEQQVHPGTQQFPAQGDPYAQPGPYGQPGQAGGWQQPGQAGGYGQPPAGYPPGSQYPPTAQWQAQFPGEPPGLGKQRSVLPWILGGAAALVVAAVLILGFVAPGWFTEKDTFKAESVEDGVRQILTEDGFTVDAVSCPSDEEVEDGNTFTCDATVDGESAEVPITVDGDDGDYEVGAPS